jgi:hypothetical protein
MEQWKGKTDRLVTDEAVEFENELVGSLNL